MTVPSVNKGIAGIAPTVTSFVVAVADVWAASNGYLNINVVCADAVLVENSRPASRTRLVANRKKRLFWRLGVGFCWGDIRLVV